MASTRQHQIDLLLNARQNSGFSAVFTKAQQEFARLGQEIQAVQRLQSDISSYQKQQTAIESTRTKLEYLQKQHDLIQKEISETTGSTAGLEREKVKLEQRIKDTEAALERQNQKLETTGARLKEAGVDTNNLAQKDQELTAKIKELEEEQKKAAEGAQSFGEKSAQAIEAAGQAIAAAGIAVAIKEVADAFLECVGTAADFEEAKSTVRALSQANAQEMAALSAEAKELGATTKFTAQEAGEAMGYMAMAGWDAADMLQGMDGVLQLAAASGEDLAMVSDIVTDSLSAFGLAAADTAHFSDVLAAAAANSNTNVAIMGETFKMSASVAGALGYSIEDVAIAMGLMANSGVKGSIAGTALRNTFNGLLEGVTLTCAAIGEYEYSAVKADGTMKDFGATIDELRGCFEQMTEAERVSNAIAIAGARGYNGLLAILNATDADYASLTDSINNCTGAAQRMASIKLDNLNGQLTLMNSAWDALRTTIGEEFNPELRGLAERGTEVLSWVNGFVQEHPALVKGAMATSGAFGGIALAITGVTAAMKLASVASGIFAGTMGAALGPVLGVAAAAAGVVGVVTALATAAGAGVSSVKELTEAARDMQEAIDEAGSAYAQTATQTMATAELAGVYIGKLKEIEAATGGNVQQNQEYQNTLALLLRTMPELSDSISQTTDQYGRVTYTLETSTDALMANAEAWKKSAEVQAYQEYLNSLYDEYNAVMLEAAENSVKLTQAQIKLETAEKNQNAALERMDELSAAAQKNGEILSEEYFQLENALYGYNDEIYTAQREIDNLNKALDKDAEAAAAAEAELESARDAVNQLTGATEEQTAAEAEAAAQTQELQEIIGDTTEQVAALADAYNDVYDAALDSISGQYALWDEAAGVIPASAEAVNQALESQAAYWRDYNENLQTVLSNAGEIEGLREMLATLDPGDKDTVNFVAGLAQASKNDKKALEDMVANWQAAKEAQMEAAGSFSDYVLDISGQMDELQQTMADTIQDMNLSDEAAEAARETIQAFIDQAGSMSSSVKAAYARLGQTALDALDTLGNVPAVVVEGSGKAKRSTRGFASGTSSAPAGWAWVGEDGPELMKMRGGETILPAEVSREYALLASAQEAHGAAFDIQNFYTEAYSPAGAWGNAPLTPAEQNDIINAQAVQNFYTENLAARNDFPPVLSFPVPYVEAASSDGHMLSTEPAPAAVLPAKAPTAATALPAAGTSPGPVQMQVTFQIEGNATPETVQDLRTFADEIVSRVMDTLEDAQANAARGRFV